MWCSSKKNSMTEIDRIAYDFADWLVNSDKQSLEELQKGLDLLRSAYMLGYSIEYLGTELDESGNAIVSLATRGI